MERVYMILVNHRPEDRAKVLLAIYQINRWLDRRAAPFQIRESIISVALQENPTIKTLKDWKKLHMPKVPSIMIVRRVNLKGHANRKQGILDSEVMDALHNEENCRRFLLWHRQPCPRHEALGRILHTAGHAVGLRHLDGGFMDTYTAYPRVKMPSLSQEKE
jgi:hypothetical protein